MTKEPMGENRPAAADAPPAKNRRSFLKMAAAALLAGCSRLDRDPAAQSVLSWFDKFNHKAGLLFDSNHRLARTYPKSAATPALMRPNGSIVAPGTRFQKVEEKDWRLGLSEVRLQGGEIRERSWQKSYTMEALRAMPAVEQTVEHVCVEGWSAICNWKGVRLADLLKGIPRRPESRFVLFICDDFLQGSRGYVPYTVTFDFKSALHPQNLLAYEYNGEKLPFAHGAPLRLASPANVGWKSAKYISHIALTNVDMGGYWENQGYPRYYGF